MKSILTLPLIFASLTACATPRASQTSLTAREAAPSSAQPVSPMTAKESIPNWVSNSPKSRESVYAVGEARNVDKKDNALERAWISALLRMGMTQFPELGSLSSQSKETLHDADYKRQFVLQLERIHWAGLKEMEEMGSPHVSVNPSTGTYTVYRLIRWSKADIITARREIKSRRKNSIPDTPEIARKNEEDLIREARDIRYVNREIANRDVFVGRVLKQARCGVTLADLVKILGPPDREFYQNNYDFPLEQKYYWGTFEVTKWSRETLIEKIVGKNGEGSSRRLCSN